MLVRTDLCHRASCGLTVADDVSHGCGDISADFGIGVYYVTRLLDPAATFRGSLKWAERTTSQISLAGRS